MAARSTKPRTVASAPAAARQPKPKSSGTVKDAAYGAFSSPLNPSRVVANSAIARAIPRLALESAQASSGRFHTGSSRETPAHVAKRLGVKPRRSSY